MDFATTTTARDYTDRVNAFISANIRPIESKYAQLVKDNQPAAIDLVNALKALAKESGLWNLFLPDSRFGPG